MPGHRFIPEYYYPKTYNFISARREKGGGFVFNPYLYTEKWIDDFEFDVLELSDGIHSVSDIIDSVSSVHCVFNEESEKRVYDCLKDLHNYCALKWERRPNLEGANRSWRNAKQTGKESTDYYSAPISILWDLTYTCNMRCQHCLVGDLPLVKEMDLEEIKKTLTVLKNAGVFRINFSGGEPLLKSDLLNILKKSSELNFGVTLSTNGLLLNRGLLEELKNLDVYCFQISLDGLGQTHDSIRGVNGAYEKTVDALKEAASMGFYTVMSTTVTKLSLHQIGRLLDLAVSLGVSSFKLNTCMQAGRGAKNRNCLAVTGEEVRLLAIEMAKKRKEYEGLIDMQLDALCPWLLCPEPVPPAARGINSSNKLGCSAGYTTLVIAPDGETFPCPFLTDFSLGNILERPLAELWHDNSGILGKLRNLDPEDLKGKCKGCGYIPEHCAGGCRAAAYVVNGDFYGEDPSCWKIA